MSESVEALAAKVRLAFYNPAAARDLSAHSALNELIALASPPTSESAKALAEQAEELAGRLSMRPLTPAEAEEAVNLILALASRTEQAEKQARERGDGWQRELERLREAEVAMRAARDELGVPDEGYPAPVANAWKILNAALDPEQKP